MFTSKIRSSNGWLNQGSPTIGSATSRRWNVELATTKNIIELPWEGC